MKNLTRFRAVCIAVLVISVAAVYLEIYVFDLPSTARLYFWAYAAIAALVSNAAAACCTLWQGRKRPQERP